MDWMVLTGLCVWSAVVGYIGGYAIGKKVGQALGTAFMFHEIYNNAHRDAKKEPPKVFRVFTNLEKDMEQ